MPSAKMNCFVDTNLLVYTVDPNEPEKIAYPPISWSA